MNGRKKEEKQRREWNECQVNMEGAGECIAQVGPTLDWRKGRKKRESCALFLIHLVFFLLFFLALSLLLSVCLDLSQM